METSLSKSGILEFRPQMADVGRDGEGKKGMEGRTTLSPNSRGTTENEREREGETDRRQESVFDRSDREKEFDHGSIEEYDENVGEELMERRKDFTLGLTRELSPIQKIGDHISTLDEPGCSSRLHGTQEESSMDTSLMSNRGRFCSMLSFVYSCFLFVLITTINIYCLKSHCTTYSFLHPLYSK